MPPAVDIKVATDGTRTRSNGFCPAILSVLNPCSIRGYSAVCEYSFTPRLKSETAELEPAGGLDVVEVAEVVFDPDVVEHPA